MTNYERYKDDPQEAFRNQVAYCKRHTNTNNRCDCPMSTGKVPCLMNWLYAEFEGCDTCKYYIGFSSQVTKGMCTLHSLLVNGDESPCVGYEEIPENENRSN